jgi:glycosyltransferase involved in cell wall biosynthesis
MKVMLANFTKMVADSGGMAKVTCAMANELQRRGHQVTLVYSDVQEGNFFYQLNPGITVYDLRHFQGREIKYPLTLKLKRELLRAAASAKAARTVNDEFDEQYLLPNLRTILGLVQPQVIISSQPEASKLLLCDAKTNVPVISMSHGDPEDYFHIYPDKEIPALEKSSVCQVLLPSFAQHLHNHLPNLKTVVIGNAVPQFKEQADLATTKNTYKILFVGRLAEQHKRPHLLVQAFAKLAAAFPNWNVELWGAEDGKIYHKKLQEMIAQNQLQKRIFIKGATTEVPQVLAQGDIFVIPSAFEGFGLSLGEAMSMGLPAIGYKNCSAVNELIVNGQNGFLCEDGVDDLTAKLKILMSDQQLRIKLGQAARKSMAAYAPEHIWDQWEKLLQESVQPQS